MYKLLIVVLYYFFSLSLNLRVKKDYEIYYFKKKKYVGLSLINVKEIM